MSFAKVTIVGRLGQDPESRYLQSGTLVVSFSMAADGRRRGGEQPSTTWFRVSAFGEQAERIANMVERGYIKKGSLLYVEGQFEARQYQGNDGQMRTSNDVNLSDWQFIGSRDGQQGQQGSGGNQGSYGGGNQDSGGQNQGNYSQDSDAGSGYGGSQYGNDFPTGDDQSDMNEVPF